MLIKDFRVVLCVTIVAYWAASASAVVLYTDDFNSPTDGANWTVNAAPAANAAQQAPRSHSTMAISEFPRLPEATA